MDKGITRYESLQAMKRMNIGLGNASRGASGFAP
jgi:hypothetical protein